MTNLNQLFKGVAAFAVICLAAIVFTVAFPPRQAVAQTGFATGPVVASVAYLTPVLSGQTGTNYVLPGVGVTNATAYPVLNSGQGIYYSRMVSFALTSQSSVTNAGVRSIIIVHSNDGLRWDLGNSNLLSLTLSTNLATTSTNIDTGGFSYWAIYSTTNTTSTGYDTNTVVTVSCKTGL